MEKKIICFGVRDYEIPYFEQLGKQYGYELVLRPQFLNTENYKDALGYEIVMVRGNCVVSYDAMKDLVLKEPGKYFVTYGNWELGIDTQTGVVYHARMLY